MKSVSVQVIFTLALVALSAIFLVAFRQSSPAPVDGDIPVKVVPDFQTGEYLSIEGNLKEGIQMKDLSWAARSSVACFPETRFVEFQGNQVFYAVNIPRRAKLVATVTPQKPRKRINIFGYINFTGSNTPPISSCVSCESGYELYAGNPDLKAPGKAQTITFGQAVNRSFTALIGVSGADGVLEGAYELKLELQPM